VGTQHFCKSSQLTLNFLGFVIFKISLILVAHLYEYDSTTEVDFAFGRMTYFGATFTVNYSIGLSVILQR